MCHQCGKSERCESCNQSKPTVDNYQAFQNRDQSLQSEQRLPAKSIKPHQKTLGITSSGIEAVVNPVASCKETTQPRDLTARTQGSCNIPNQSWSVSRGYDEVAKIWKEERAKGRDVMSGYKEIEVYYMRGQTEKIARVWVKRADLENSADEAKANDEFNGSDRKAMESDGKAISRKPMPENYQETQVLNDTRVGTFAEILASCPKDTTSRPTIKHWISGLSDDPERYEAVRSPTLER